MTKSIGSVARGYITANPAMKNEEILALVKNDFPEAKTSLACIGWYKSKMKKEAKAAPAVARTVEQIEQEILELQCELDDLKEAQAQALIDEEQELREKLAKIEELKAKQQEEETA